jgi:hypothetical protein
MTKLLPFEHVILSTVGSSLLPEQRGQFGQQIAHINKVQRLLEWNEIEFYSMRWFKVRWPPAVLFQNHGEFELGSGTLQAQGLVARVKVWAVGGHVFSIESEVSLKPFRSAAHLSFLLADAAQPSAPADRPTAAAPLSSGR